MSYNNKPLNKSKPPYNEIEYNPAPNAVVGGRNNEPKNINLIKLNDNKVFDITK